VLPAHEVEISADGAEANGLPECTVGLSYWFEPVPTDVEVARNGSLVVSSLTGGPEDGSLGAQSRVFRIDPRTGHVRLVADGLAGAVGVAVARNGDLFVSQLFGGAISRIPAGTSTPRRYRSVSTPGAVEWTRHGLYATTDVLNQDTGGNLVRYRH
jgi:sugar lactone lactonase YvrE